MSVQDLQRLWSYSLADGNKLFLIDFSNTLKGEPNEVLNDNYNRLGNFFKDFGFERMDYISRGMALRTNLTYEEQRI